MTRRTYTTPPDDIWHRIHAAAQRRADRPDPPPRLDGETDAAYIARRLELTEQEQQAALRRHLRRIFA